MSNLQEALDYSDSYHAKNDKFVRIVAAAYRQKCAEVKCMLDALIKCQNELRSTGHESIALNMESVSPLLQEVRMAIKKATGKTWYEINEVKT